MKNTSKFCLQHLPIVYNEDLTIYAEVWQDEFNLWHYKVKYPKCGKSHFYSMVNYVDSLFDEQHPYWANIFKNQNN